MNFHVTRTIAGTTFCVLFLISLFLSGCNSSTLTGQKPEENRLPDTKKAATGMDTALRQAKVSSTLDTVRYNRIMDMLTHHQPDSIWPAKASLPLSNAVTPFKRIIAYYGNLYSRGMGILGALPPDQMLEKLQAEVKNWEMADSTLPVQPALHYIAVTAQHQPGSAKMYRLRMPFHQIDTVLSLARKINAIVFLDIQVGHSSLQEELPLLKKYLLMPDVHLGIDPEFSMKNGKVPSSSIGTFDAADVNYASEYLAQLVQENHIPAKVLVIHRFTQGMITNYRNIVTRPEIQIVMSMDGFGFPAKKQDSYRRFITREPVQFTGFKVFYKNDIQLPKWPTVMQPEDILKLYPQPVYIQYQ